MKKDYYESDEIKAKFRIYTDLKESSIASEEYERFCGELKMLPRDIVDNVYDEIYFVLMSAKSGNEVLACYANLNEGHAKNKDRIIVLSPIFFGFHYIDKDGKQTQIDPWDNQLLLHEVAHHVLGHEGYKNKRDKDEKEKAAKAQTREWVSRYLNSNIGE